MAFANRNRQYIDLPDHVSGYELNPEHGLFSVIVPEESTNLISNPSMETNLTGYTAMGFGVTIAKVSTKSSRGIYSCEVTPAAGLPSGVSYAVALTAGLTYSFSLDVWDVAGQIYDISAQDGTYSLTSAQWTGTGAWKRKSFTFVAKQSTTYNIYLREISTDGTLPFYTDGWQLEEKAYSTTYFDGDMKGFLVSESVYLWNGLVHGSTSWRSRMTRSGGKEVNLLDLGFRLVTILGLGMAPLVDQSLPLPGLGELAQGTGTKAREFTLVGNLYSDGSQHLSSKLAELEDIFKPDLVSIDQPLILRYQAYAEDEPCGDQVEIVCKYRGGLEGAVTNNHGIQITLTFKQYIPFISGIFENIQELGYRTLLTAPYLVMRSTSGVWSKVGTGVGNVVLALEKGKDNSIYAGGQFTVAGGTPNTDYVARYAGGSWSALDEGVDNHVYALKVDAADNLYVGGLFPHAHTTGATPVAGTAYIAKWNGAWNPMGEGANSHVNAIAVDNSGNVYIGGAFTHVHATGGADVADTNKIAKWDGATWTALETGVDDEVYALTIGPNGDLYAGGAFLNAGGRPASCIARWNGVTWAQVGAGVNGVVNAIAFGKDGSLYVGGEFTQAGDVDNTQYLAKWTGSQWISLGLGVNAAVHTILANDDGTIFVGGHFTTAGGLTLPDRMAIWNGSTWLPMDISFTGSPYFTSSIRNTAGDLFIGHNYGTGTAYSATVTTPNTGSATTYPIIKYIGPGTIYQLRNYTTGKEINFNITLVDGETATLNLNPFFLSFTSSFRGNILSTIQSGSNFKFELVPGVNNISSFMYGNTGANTNIFMIWKKNYWSINGAIWK